MHIFRCRLIDFFQCLKLKAAFRQLTTFGELLILLNSSTCIQFYHRAMQRPTQVSSEARYLRGQLAILSHAACPSASLSRVNPPPFSGEYTHFFSHLNHVSLMLARSHEYHVNNNNEIIIEIQMESSVPITDDCTHITISFQSYNL